MIDIARLQRHCSTTIASASKPCIVIEGTDPPAICVATVNNAYFVTMQATETYGLENAGDKLNELVCRHLALKVPETAVDTTVEKLIAWTGEASWTGPCSECEGTGRVPGECLRCKGTEEIECYCPNCDDEHKRDCPDCMDRHIPLVKSKSSEPVVCEDCTGTGQTSDMSKMTYQLREGEVAGVHIDLNLLARILSDVSGVCKMWGDEQALIIRGEGWHVTLMCLRSDKPSDIHVYQP